MKSVCLIFQIHQPFRYRKYRFFDIGRDNYYYDDFANETIIRKIADNCYLPANKIILEQIRKHKGKFRVAFSISGVVVDQFKLYCPEVISSFVELAETGSVEFLSETYANSLVSLVDAGMFEEQVVSHDKMIEELFGQRPSVFRNTELIYSDEIGDVIYKMGYEGVITEGAKHILGWKSPNYLYCNALNPRLKVLMRNFRFSDDLSFRFSNKGWNEYPLTADKYASWMKNLPKKEEIINIFINYETFGQLQPKNSGIFDFMRYLPDIIIKTNELEFATPAEVIQKHQPVSAIHVPHHISWADEERDLTAWLGNELQKEAFDKLYRLKDKIRNCTDKRLLKDWIYLQTNDHLYYMCTKFFSDGEVHKSFNPYGNPYEAFINYMNVMSDFSFRLNALVPTSSDSGMENVSEIEITAEKPVKVTSKAATGTRSKKASLSDKKIKKKTTKGKEIKSLKPVGKKVTVQKLKKQ